MTHLRQDCDMGLRGRVVGIRLQCALLLTQSKLQLAQNLRLRQSTGPGRGRVGVLLGATGELGFLPRLLRSHSIPVPSYAALNGDLVGNAE